MEVRDQEQAVVQQEVRGRHGDQDAGESADDKGHHEADRPHHRRGKADTAGEHREQPVVDLHAGRHCDDHAGDAEDGVHVGSGAHREKMMQPHHEGDDADRHGGEHHRAVAEQRLAREGRDHFREDAEGRQHQDIDLGMAPGPDQVHEHHHVATGFVGEKMESEIAVEDQHRQRRGQDWECGDDQKIRGERGPAEHRHAHVGHASGADLQNRRDQVDAGDQRADAGDLQRPQIIVDADARRIGQLRQRWVWQPAGAREFTDHKRDVDQQRTGRGQPEANRVERRKRHVADAELQRHDEIHQSDHERHCHEEDHDGAVRGENLIVVLRRKETIGAIGHR